MLAGSTDDAAADSPAEHLERMKSEFLAAQQRRRERAGAVIPDHTDDRPTLVGPADGAVTGIAAVRP